VSLAPLANFFAVRGPESVLESVARRLVDEGIEPRRPHPGWVVGHSRLPSSSDGAADRLGPARLARGVLVAEGDRQLDADTQVLLDRLNGPAAALPSDVTLVALGPPLTLVRSAAGLVPLYVLERGDVLAVSTRLVWFERLVDPPPIDPLGHAAWTDGMVLPDRRTTRLDVRSIPAGCRAVLDGGRERLERHWVPPQAADAPAGVERAMELRSLLAAAVGDELDDGPNLIGMSGGVDSSVLAVLAAGAGRPLRAFTLLPGADHPALAEAEHHLETIVEAVRPSAHHRVHLDEESRLAVLGNAPRLGIPIAHPALALLPELLAGERVFTGGEFADDLFGGPYAIWFDWLAAMSAAQLVARLRTRGLLPVRRHAARRWLTHRWARLCRRGELPIRSSLPELFRPELREEYREWAERRAREMAALPGPYRALELTRRTDGWVAQNWEVCSELGVRRSLPFYRREIFELAYRCHPLDHAMPPKSLLRCGFAGLVPERNLFRSGKGAFAEAATVPWGRTLDARLEPLVREDLLETRPAELAYDDADALAIIEVSTEAARRR